MIKKFFLMAALLTPGLAYGDASNTLNGPQVNPAGSDPPAPATAAGFTTPVMKVDFTTVDSTWPANNIVECGASESVGGQPSGWHFHIVAPGNISLPCARATIVTDTAAGPSGSHQALQFQYLTTDPPANGSGANLSWPYKGFNGNAGPWMPDAYYAKIVFRWDAQTVYQNGNSDDGWWSTSASTGLSTWADLNMGETTYGGATSAGHNSWGGGYWEWVTGGCSPGSPSPPHCNLFAGVTSPVIDFTTYHTFEFLWTQDGSANAAECYWMDGVLQNCGSGSFVNSVNYSEHDRIINWAMGVTYNTSNLSNNATGYIQDYEVWSCPGFATGTCAGTVISHWPP
jgi:hypothetical protein